MLDTCIQAINTCCCLSLMLIKQQNITLSNIELYLIHTVNTFKFLYLNTVTHYFIGNFVLFYLSTLVIYYLIIDVHSSLKNVDLSLVMLFFK